MSLPSLRYSRWHDSAWTSLPRYIPKVTEPCSVIISYWMPDNRRRDLTNITESIMDFLVDRGIISDDRWQVIGAITIASLGIDRENPRAEININALSDDGKETGLPTILRLLRMLKGLWPEGDTDSSQATRHEDKP